MNPLSVMTQIFIKGLSLSAPPPSQTVQNGVRKRGGETAQNNFLQEFNFFLSSRFFRKRDVNGIALSDYNKSKNSNLRAGRLSQAAPRGPRQGREDRAMTASMWVIWLSSGRSRLSPPMCQISCGMTRWAAGAEAGAVAGEEARRQYPV